MKEKPNNPNAFPLEYENGDFQTGITLRDYFAAKAMQSSIPENPTGCWGGYPIGINDINTIAELSYLIADAMLNQREK